MIVDSSALVAILKDEPDAPLFAAALAEHAGRLAAPTFLEASIVVGPERQVLLDEMLRAAGVLVEPFTEEHALGARDAYVRYGKGSGSPAQLNFGDCIAYALARHRDEPLLYKGGDFAHTDVVPALAAHRPRRARER